MLAVWNHIENPLAYAIPFFFAFVGIEAALLRVGDKVKFRAITPEEFARWK